MRFSRVVRASDSQCRSRNCPGFDLSILRHSGIRGAADDTVLNTVHKKTYTAESSLLHKYAASFLNYRFHILYRTLFCDFPRRLRDKLYHKTYITVFGLFLLFANVRFWRKVKSAMMFSGKQKCLEFFYFT
jgi:hypothetical protein